MVVVPATALALQVWAPSSQVVPSAQDSLPVVVVVVPVLVVVVVLSSLLVSVEVPEPVLVSPPVVVVPPLVAACVPIICVTHSNPDTKVLTCCSGRLSRGSCNLARRLVQIVQVSWVQIKAEFKLGLNKENNSE